MACAPAKTVRIGFIKHACKTVRFATSVVELIPHHWTIMIWWLVIIVRIGFIKHATCRDSKVCPKASSSAVYVWRRTKKRKRKTDAARQQKAAEKEAVLLSRQIHGRGGVTTRSGRVTQVVETNKPDLRQLSPPVSADHIDRIRHRYSMRGAELPSEEEWMHRCLGCKCNGCVRGFTMQQEAASRSDPLERPWPTRVSRVDIGGEESSDEPC